MQITIFKLLDVLKIFYSSNPELQKADISWENCKAKILHTFRDLKSDQYHFMQLQTTREKKDKTPQEFLTRCRLLAMKTVHKIEDPLLKKFIMTKLKGCYCRHS